MGRRTPARETFVKALAVVRTEAVGDIAKVCLPPTGGEPFLVIEPLWSNGPSADAERTKIRAGGGTRFVANGKCSGYLLFPEESEDSRSQKRTLKYWIQGYAK